MSRWLCLLLAPVLLGLALSTAGCDDDTAAPPSLDLSTPADLGPHGGG